ncbi:hypothetical protein ACFPMF_21010 [Larkinella bovis]|uniref:Uncharacterized protein n=1 Tax=Larkinella bovis TaxID=683041 RepID=A0ABW0IEX9_9BACT
MLPQRFTAGETGSKSLGHTFVIWPKFGRMVYYLLSDGHQSDGYEESQIEEITPVFLDTFKIIRQIDG